MLLAIVVALVRRNASGVRTSSASWGWGKVRVAKSFYELEEATGLLGVSVGEVEEMASLGELAPVTLGTSRRLVRVRDMDAALARVEAGGNLRTRREYRGRSVEEAVLRVTGALGVAPERLTYKVLDRGSPWVVGLRAREARVAADLPAGRPETAAEDGRDGASPPGPGGERRPEHRGRGPRLAGRRRKLGSAKTRATITRPSRVARILVEDAYAVNLRIYREELPTVDINGYRWIPREAVEDLLRDLGAPCPADPPRPFMILRPREGAEDAAGAPWSGGREIRRKTPRRTPRSPSSRG